MNLNSLLFHTEKMSPSRGDLHIASFNDETLYMEQFNRQISGEEVVVLRPQAQFIDNFGCRFFTRYQQSFMVLI